MRKKKGFVEILTTFFLLVVMVGVAIAFVGFNKGFLVIQHKVNDELSDFTTSHIVREKLTSCFGIVMDPDNITALKCRDDNLLEVDLLANMIHSFYINQTDHYNCKDMDWEWTAPNAIASAESEYHYYVPIRNKTHNLVCMGELTIRI